MTRDRRRVAAALAALMVIAALPRIVGLRAWMLSGDEAWHGYLATLPSLRALLVETLRHDAHPPIYYLVLRASIACGLNGEPLMLRVPGLAAGLLSIPVFYALGCLVARSRAGGVAAALIASFSHALVALDQPVRHYSLSVLLLSLTLVCFFSSWRFKEAGYFVCAFLTAQTHHAATLVIGVIAVVGFVERVRERRALIRWCAFHAVVLTIMWLEIRVHPWRDWMDTFMAGGMLTSARAVAVGLTRVVSSGHLGDSSPAPWLLALPFVAGLVVLIRERRWAVVTISLAPLAVASLLAALRLYPLVGPARIYCWLIPSLVLPIAAAFARWRGWALAAALVLFAANEALAGGGRLWRPDELRVGNDWPRRQQEEAALFALVREHVEPPVPVVVSWSEDRNDFLARRLDWRTHVFPIPHLTKSAELPPEGEGVDWEIGPDELHASVRFGAGATTWVLLGPKPEPQLPKLERLVLADPCLAGARAFATSRYLLLAVDGEASRSRLSQPDCR